jgi:hypothetical protein
LRRRARGGAHLATAAATKIIVATPSLTGRRCTELEALGLGLRRVSLLLRRLKATLPLAILLLFGSIAAIWQALRSVI